MIDCKYLKKSKGVRMAQNKKSAYDWLELATKAVIALAALITALRGL
jgi:hypothetical protein